LILFEGEISKPRRLTRLTAYFFAGVAVAACGLPRSTAAYGGLRRRLLGL